MIPELNKKTEEEIEAIRNERPFGKILTALWNLIMSSIMLFGGVILGYFKKVPGMTPLFMDGLFIWLVFIVWLNARRVWVYSKMALTLMKN